MKTRKIFLTIFVAAFAALLLGASAFPQTIEAHYFVDGAEMKETLRLTGKDGLYLGAVYGGDLVEYGKNEFSGNYSKMFGYLDGEFYRKVEALCERLERPGISASVVWDKGTFLYEEGFLGRRVDRERLFFELARAVTDRSVAQVVFDPIPPDLSVADLRGITRKMASYSTDYSKSAEGRKSNVRLACERLDGTIVPSGGVLSFNEIVGERTRQNGFSNAKIIVDGVFVEGIGGGVCQVSTTLFDAWLYAGLSVERAAAHSLPVSYVAPSLDAMVSSASDLLLKNDSDFPVYLRVKADGKKITVDVFGKPSPYSVRLKSVTEKILPAVYAESLLDLDWQEGETERIVKKKKDGRISVAYREYYEGERLVKREFLRRNVYKPQDGERALKPKADE
ncbi:MAG: VanW family protein [Clostridia bacterium]|nr:VanW family protein [Clostridia bacterium]